MARAQKMVFWMSLLAALGGLAACYGFGLLAPLAGQGESPTLAAGDVGTAESSQAADETGEAAADGASPAAEIAPTTSSAWWRRLTPALSLLMVVFAAIPFAAAWHGGSLAKSGDNVAAAALWGLIPALLLAAAGLGWLALNLWAADQWDWLLLRSSALPLGIVAGVAWELGFTGVMPFVPRSEDH